MADEDGVRGVPRDEESGERGGGGDASGGLGARGSGALNQTSRVVARARASPALPGPPQATASSLLAHADS